MLIDFTVENFRSYKDQKVFQLTPSGSKELPANLANSSIEDIRALRAAVIYGANAAGKSNLLLAMEFIGAMLRNPLHDPMGDDSPIKRPITFALDLKMAKKPSRVRVRFVSGKNLYDYALSVRQGVVVEESLTVHPDGGRGQEWFVRQGAEIKFNQTHLKGPKQRLQDFVAPQNTLLAVAIAFGHQQLSEPASWLHRNLRLRFELGEGGAVRKSAIYPTTAQRCHSDPVFRNWVEELLRYADLGISGVEVQVTVEKLRRPVTQPGVEGGPPTRVFREVETERHIPYIRHTGVDDYSALFELSEESQGTRRLFWMLSPLYDVFQLGEVAIVDELGASMHPTLVREVVRLFQNPEINRNGAQLLFATHNTSLLTGDLFRRDQVWFTEKDDIGATDLYSLVEFKDAREGEHFERGYLRGRYGAIPFFGKFNFPELPEPEGSPQS